LLAVGLPERARLVVEIERKRNADLPGAGDDDLTLGETVLALGNPLGGEVVVSAGVVSAMRAREGGRVQADPNLGNQNGGGAIVDVTGRIVGIGDAGPTDPIAMAFAMRGERMTTESNLSTFVGIRRVRQVFLAELEGRAPTAESTPAAADAAHAHGQRPARDAQRLRRANVAERPGRPAPAGSRGSR
jgi:hypothetical protein